MLYRMKVFLAVGVACALSLGACGDGSNDGELGGHCYPNGTCNIFLACSGGICVSSPLDAAIDAPTDVAVDALPDAALCRDASFEPNDTIQTAFASSVATTQLSQTFAFAICPAGDRDHVTINITTANTNAEVIVTYPGGSGTNVSILNGGGTSINNGTANGANSKRAYAANLPIGTYYAQAYAAAGEVHDYSMTITVTGP